MTALITATSERSAPRVLSPGATRLALLLVIGAALAAGYLATGAAAETQATAAAGADLVRLLRFMAALKAVMATAAVGAVLWRLAAAVTMAWFAAYGLACAAMAAGPMLIWTMAHVGAGALLLHGGLLAAVLLLWRDPATAERLAQLVAARRRISRR